MPLRARILRWKKSSILVNLWSKESSYKRRRLAYARYSSCLRHPKLMNARLITVSYQASTSIWGVPECPLGLSQCDSFRSVPFASFVLPIPLTWRTGTEEAVHTPESGFCQPWTPRSDDFASIHTGFEERMRQARIIICVVQHRAEAVGGIVDRSRAR